MNEPHIFYDGTCGLCHFMVRFVVKRMEKAPFFFAPLDGPTFQSFKIDSLPDSLVVYLPESQQCFFKGKAVIFIFKRLGNPWNFLGAFLNLLPLKFVDASYSLVAKIRNKLFKRPKTTCPSLPKDLKKFFKE